MCCLSFAQSLSAPALRRLNKELAQLQANAIEGVRITVDDGDVSNLLAWIEGPGESLPLLLHLRTADERTAQTPYEGLFCCGLRRREERFL